MTRVPSSLRALAIVVAAGGLLTLGSLPAFAIPGISASGSGSVVTALTSIGTGTGSEANGVAATATHLYVADGPHDKILVYSLNGTAQAPIALSSGDFPFDIALSSDGSTLWVADLGSSRITEIDTASSTVTTSFSAVAGHDIKVSPDGSVVYELEDGDSQVHAFSTVSTPIGDVVATSVTNGLYQTPSSLAISPDGNTVYVTYRDGAGGHPTGGMRLLHASDLSEITSDDFQDAAGLAVEPNGDVLVGYGTGNSGEGEVQVLTSSGTLLGLPMSVGTEPSTVVVSTDGDTAFIGDGNEGQLYAVDIATSTVSGPLGPVGGAESMAVAPDGFHLYSTSGNVIPGTVFPFAIAQVALSGPASVAVGGAPVTFDAQIADGQTPVSDYTSYSVKFEVINSADVVVASVTVAPDASGDASGSIDLSAAPAGTYSVRATLDPPAGSVVVTATGFTVGAAAGGGAVLAATGVDAVLPAGVAVLLLLVGAIILLARRRAAARV